MCASTYFILLCGNEWMNAVCRRHTQYINVTDRQTDRIAVTCSALACKASRDINWLWCFRGDTRPLIRPPDIVVGGLRFYRDCLLLLPLFSSSTFQPRWTELNQNRPQAWRWVRFENVCPKSGVSSTRTNRGPKHTFRRFRNVTWRSHEANIFRTKYPVYNRTSMLETTIGVS